ncbi:methylated-DNA--[protein]-cysteine S-methyltransferase [Vibrio aphrogenes]|uniref:methylated-DNA--[protein]-cysteine S-methyltransferase n=1 Tax=Vibrio aphrogenes TaxID=1891186 RepID=UPI000B34BA2D|nr:methylated-DNA--[protein]-cysteine S-methyltransferase [Vibrio aphrogenes]
MATPTYYFDTFTTPVCEVTLMGSEYGLHLLHLETGEGKKDGFQVAPDWVKDSVRFAEVKQQLEAYFLGKRCDFNFSMPLEPQGTVFQQSVWQALRQIPSGATCRYKDIADQIDNPKAVRAVGAAIGRNPIPIIIPCHRVVGADGSLTGFAHGLAMKRQLLRLEGYLD